MHRAGSWVPRLCQLTTKDPLGDAIDWQVAAGDTSLWTEDVLTTVSLQTIVLSITSQQRLPYWVVDEQCACRCKFRAWWCVPFLVTTRKLSILKFLPFKHMWLHGMYYCLLLSLKVPTYFPNLNFPLTHFCHAKCIF